MPARVLAIVVVVVVVVYHLLRVAASGCSGGACDWYVPFSLLLPLLAIALAAITGVMAAVQARAQPGWAILLAGGAVIAVAGPVTAAFAFSDNDTKVWIATALVLVVPLAVFLKGRMT